MNQRKLAAASLPPSGITGLNPAWSRLVTVKDSAGELRTWHLLDSWSERNVTDNRPTLTLLCVHGNPSWSFLWRHVLAQAPHSIRVIAVDQLDMGFSERTGVKRTLANRIDDLCRLTAALELTGPVVTIAHDWGGPISLGWALRHLPEHEQTSLYQGRPCLAGVVLTNTAVHQPESASAPAVIRMIRSPALLRLLTVNSSAFINGAIKMSKPALAQDVCAGFHAPYLQASRRAAIADFVADIPLNETHESASTLDGIAKGLDRLADTPALLVWGARDRVFNDMYLADFEERLPHADVHRYPEAAHFVTEDEDVAGGVLTWLSTWFDLDTSGSGELDDQAVSDVAPDVTGETATGKRRALADFSVADQGTLAVVETGADGRSITYDELSEKVTALASGMAAFGIVPGTRVAVMIMPGVDLSVVVYACWRLGATLVLVDSGLGKKGMQRALCGAVPEYLIGIDKALLAARLLGWPGRRIAVHPCSSGKMRLLNILSDVESLCKLGRGKGEPPWPDPETVAVVAFTSGSTGPSKGVVYLHRQIEAQRESLMSLYGITSSDRLVAAFAPFALYGPTMGITSMVPDMNVTQPGTLTAKALVAAVERIKATLVFASPAALVNVVATGQQLAADTLALRSAVRLVLSAGAPVRASLLEAAAKVFPDASMHTPYGMTEVLPVADISLEELKQAGAFASALPEGADVGPELTGSAGVCVGYPLEGVQISIDPLDTLGVPAGTPIDAPDILGEIIVRAEHIRHGYDRLWFTQSQASQPAGSHRTGDIGQLDSQGRLWVGGRLGHVIVTPEGPLAPVACEQIIETISNIDMAAVVGVGPAGAQAVVAVVQTASQSYAVGGAPLELVDRIRQVVQSMADITAVLVVKRLPVDRRHNSKVDRTAVSNWAAGVLAGNRMREL